MNNLIPIIEHEGRRTVNARDLYDFLDVGRVFAAWIRERISKYGFVEGEDFIPVSEKSTGGRPEIDYYLSVDMAKELSMVENNDKGREARRYFIACENALSKRSVSVKTLLRDSKELRNGLTDIWQDRGAKKWDFKNLTHAEYKALGYNKVSEVKKENMTRLEIAKLAGLEMFESMKLERHAEITGYYGLKDSIGETGAAIETALRYIENYKQARVS